MTLYRDFKNCHTNLIDWRQVSINDVSKSNEQCQRGNLGWFVWFVLCRWWPVCCYDIVSKDNELASVTMFKLKLKAVVGFKSIWLKIIDIIV